MAHVVMHLLQLERKKQRQEDVVAEMVKIKLDEKKAAEKRKESRMAAVQKQLQKPSVSKAPTAIRSQTSSKAELSREQNTALAKDAHSQPVARSLKSPKPSSSQSATHSSNPPKSKSSKAPRPNERPPKSQPSSLTHTRKSLPAAHVAAVPSRSTSTKSQAAPLSFQELLSIAQKKTTEPPKDLPKEDLRKAPRQSSVPAPKEVVSGQKRKSLSVGAIDSTQHRGKSKSPATSMKLSTNGTAGHDRGSSHSPKPTGDRSNGPKPTGDRSNGPKPSIPPRAVIKAHHTIPQREPPKSAPVVPPSQKNPYLNSVQAIDFYGTSFSKLSQNGRPNFATPAKPKHSSSWAGEVADMLERRKLHGGSQDMGEEEEEEEEDMSDFVEEGEDDFIDDSEACDYSSAIREIFGYDKRK